MQETTLIEQDRPVEAVANPMPAPAPTMTLCSYGTKLAREERLERRLKRQAKQLGYELVPIQEKPAA